MSRELRSTDPDAHFLITSRTVNSELWLKPTPEMTQTIGGIYARYQEKYKIEINALTVLSNHSHALVRAPDGNLSEFAENVQREISRRSNFINGRSGSLWGARYSAQRILTEEDLLEAFLYVTTNAVKHGLVDHPSKWPGLNSYLQSLRGEPEYYRFKHYSQLVNGKPVETTHALIISPISVHEGLIQTERKKEFLRLVSGRVDDLRDTRTKAGLGFLGVRKILAQVPGERPRSTSKSPKPPCYSKNVEAIREFNEANKELKRVYSEASYEF